MIDAKTLTVAIEMPDDFEAKVRDSIESAVDDVPFWRVWVYRNGSGYDTGALVSASDEEDALERADLIVDRVLAATGTKCHQHSAWDVEVVRLIE